MHQLEFNNRRLVAATGLALRLRVSAGATIAGAWVKLQVWARRHPPVGSRGSGAPGRAIPPRALCLGLVASLLAGCAAKPRTAITLDMVGPLVAASGGLTGGPTGYLEVHTETEPYNDGGFVYYRHTPYSVYDLDGRQVKSVVNRVGMTDQRPMIVPLPAGQYRVYARAEGYGLVEVPVFVVGSRLTAVYLERGGMDTGEDLPESTRVRLPDGRTVGRRAERPPQAPSR